ncbi:S-layer homology domain-containing protein [Paenibacillus glycinis]|uniref:S-layer homology domain-containing protein n=1 Tax=Paenibacillus glycinis TaxID=2697035 RepID=A0ABW9XWD3_9BACL|nr:S-layer homology domain-containing protein [Paenibacillus glycinis]NBD26562.1 S-layer homology domain-containing protein [Paenibacillus glycinis]
MKKAMFKKAAVTSMALLTLAGGAGSAFADGKGNGHEDKHNSGKHDDKGNIGKPDDKGKGGINLHFKDEDDLKWAMEYIIRLASKGVFNGYDDGTFKPQQHITRIESIVAAVRLMGLKDQAESAAEMGTKLNFKDADQLKKKYPWAVGYVAVALEKDLFTETDDAIQADKPATRVFAATLLVKALGLEAEAKAKSNSQLNFRDAGKIPAGSVGYVEVAIEKNLITGYEDNTFRPNQPVTRAELAALLDRTDDQLPDHDAAAITGKLKASASNGIITVVKSDNSEVALALDPNVFVFRDNVKANVSALKAGDEVLVRTFQNKVVFVEVTKSAVDQPAVTTQTGKFNSLSLNAQGQIATISITKEVNGGTQALVLNVSPTVTVVGNAALLENGHAVELTLLNGVVISIKVV